MDRIRSFLDRYVHLSSNIREGLSRIAYPEGSVPRTKTILLSWPPFLVRRNNSSATRHAPPQQQFVIEQPEQMSGTREKRLSSRRRRQSHKKKDDRSSQWAHILPAASFGRPSFPSPTTRRNLFHDSFLCSGRRSTTNRRCPPSPPAIVSPLEGDHNHEKSCRWYVLPTVHTCIRPAAGEC